MSGIKSLFGGAKPAVAAAVRMPDSSDPATIEAGRLKAAKQIAATGRQSTNLTGNTASYVSDKLGV